MSGTKGTKVYVTKVVTGDGSKKGKPDQPNGEKAPASKKMRVFLSIGGSPIMDEIASCDLD